ncbi:tail fiber protein [Aeromonas phage Akh-2]|nr:tail fiber protein [Aeromonas phage Akh-2]
MSGSLNIDGGYLRLNRTGNNNLIEFHNPGTAAAMIYMGTGGQLRFTTSNGSAGETFLRMAIETSGLVSAPDFQVTSDRSLKSEFQPIINALDKVDKLFGYTYMKKGKTVREAGLVAQDVE